MSNKRQTHEVNTEEALTPFHWLYGWNVNTESINSDVVNDPDNARYLRQRYTVLKQVWNISTSFLTNILIHYMKDIVTTERKWVMNASYELEKSF